MVEPKEKRVVNVEFVVDQPGADPTMLETHVKILELREQGLRVVDALNLAEDPEFQIQQSSTGAFSAAKRLVFDAVIRYAPHAILDAISMALESIEPITGNGSGIDFAAARARRTRRQLTGEAKWRIRARTPSRSMKSASQYRRAGNPTF